MASCISILGCGWLGMPLARYFAHLGFQVRGSTTDHEKFTILIENNIQPYLIQLDPQINSGYHTEFFESEILVVNIPPGRRPDIEAYYLQQMTALVQVIEKSPVKKVLFVSSTSVYPDVDREVTEEETLYADKASGKALLRAERLFLQNRQFKTTVLRFCGLYGPGRNPGRFLAGKVLQTSGRAGVNLIHLDDCLQIIRQIVEQEAWGEIFNACADEHPAKKDFYLLAARASGLAAPQFNGEEEEHFKIINSKKLKASLGYRFRHPDPLKSV